MARLNNGRLIEDRNYSDKKTTNKEDEKGRWKIGDILIVTVGVVLLGMFTINIMNDQDWNLFEA